MNKYKGILAVTVFVLLAGAADGAFAGGGGVSAPPNNKVRIDIRNLQVEAASERKNGPDADVAALDDNKKEEVGKEEIAQNVDGGGSAESAADANAVAADSGGAAAAAVAGGASGGTAGTGDSASSAAPIFLNTGDDICMGSGGLGVQSLDVGVSIGSTWRDENCVMLKNARELKNQGYDKAARARLCMNEDNALAFELAGEPCPRALPATQAALERIRAWNPAYQAAAAAPVQLAALDAGGAGDRAVAVLAPASAQDVARVSRGFSSFVDTIKAFFRAMADAGAADTDVWQSVYDSPE